MCSRVPLKYRRYRRPPTVRSSADPSRIGGFFHPLMAWNPNAFGEFELGTWKVARAAGNLSSIL
jgi:hypothetical protein